MKKITIIVKVFAKFHRNLLENNKGTNNQKCIILRGTNCIFIIFYPSYK